MKLFYRRLLIVSILAAGILFAVPVMAYNVVVDNFGGTSSNGSFVSHVWTPTGEPSNLSFADLLAEITTGNVEIITSGSGNITIHPSFGYALAADRQLTLSAQGDITIRGINASGTGELSVVADATGAVINQAAGLYTNGGAFTSYGTNFSSSDSGLQTNSGDILIHHTGTVTIVGGGIYPVGGSFTSYGTDFSVSGTGLVTAGGNVVLHHTGAVSIIDGGIHTSNGSFTSYGTSFSVAGSGLDTDVGDINLQHTEAVSITGFGIHISNRSFTSSGTDFFVSGTGLATTGGNVRLNHTGNINLTGGGIVTDGGSFTSSGADFRIEGTGLQTSSGNATLNHTGNVNITGSGIETDGGDLRINSSATASFENNGVQTNGGIILVQSNGLIHVNPATNFSSGGMSDDGGDITLRSATGITLDSAIGTQIGTGGQLFLQGNTAAIVRNQQPVLGAGDIILYVGSLQPASIPTLSEWGMIIMSLILLVTALQAIRQKTGFSSRA